MLVVVLAVTLVVLAEEQTEMGFLANLFMFGGAMFYILKSEYKRQESRLTLIILMILLFFFVRYL